jgi:hypothetical protein
MARGAGTTWKFFIVIDEHNCYIHSTRLANRAAAKEGVSRDFSEANSLEVHIMPTPGAEQRRLDEQKKGAANWRAWGPYVSERSWGSVREDYSADGNAWDYFNHDMARSRAFRWGEDGIAGLCDRYQLLVFAPAFWNGRDPILKERLFGLTPGEANHGEDVKEYYFHLDATPTHSYQRYLYKYPQLEYPYGDLIAKNRSRSAGEPEYELLDTGIFDRGRYFDIFIEYAKASSEDIAIRIEIFNHGPEAAELHVLPQLWFRNRWSWGVTSSPAPVLSVHGQNQEFVAVVADEADAEPLKNLPFEYKLGKRYLYAPADGKPLFTDNETDAKSLFGPGAVNRSQFVKDAFHRRIIKGENCTNPAQRGSKAGIHCGPIRIAARQAHVIRLRLTNAPLERPLTDVDRIVAERRKEMEEFYAALAPAGANEEERKIQRQAYAGLLWTKQIYLFDVDTWLEGDRPDWPPPESRKSIRNVHWRHLNSMRVLSMPDKWEYPWFAAWDLAFHTLPLALIDPEYAKEQLWLMLFEQFQHPNGQIPAYEWEFADLNPPVHAWAVWRVYLIDRDRTGQGDTLFLEKCFHKLLINFAWWVNRVDVAGNNLFEGGFLGLDNITLVDRSMPLAAGTKLLQSDATGWMGMFCLNLMRIALELSTSNKAYLGLATKFFQHFIYIGAALNRKSSTRFFELWSERDGFFYDLLIWPDGSYHKFRVRSLVGLIPLFGVEALDDQTLAEHPEFQANVMWFLRNRSDLTDRCVTVIERNGRRQLVLKLLSDSQLRQVLSRIADPSEFHSPFGLRSLSKYHQEHPFEFNNARVGYEPAEAVSRIKGGNSNWRGPVWFPTSYLLIESLRKLAQVYGDDFTFPSLSDGGPGMTLTELARKLAEGLIRLFQRGPDGMRPADGKRLMFRDDPHWRDLMFFHEYFHADTGEGLGASHQTGWTALVASLIDEWRK